MITTRAARLLILLSTLFTISHQQSSWWISKTKLFTDDGTTAVIYNTRTRNSTEVLLADVLYESNNLRSFSHDLSYAAEIIKNPDAHLYPDRKNFTLIIHDNIENVNYTIGKEIFTFKWSHGHAFSFADENGTYYVPSPGDAPIKLTSDVETSDDQEKLHLACKSRPNGVVLDGSLSGKEGGELFSPSDKFLAFTSRTSNSSQEEIMTVYDRVHFYDYHYTIPFLKFGEIWCQGISASYYLYWNPSWVVLHGKELLIVPWANRWQNETTLTLCSPETGSCTKIFEHKYEPRQWVMDNDFENIVFSNSSIFVILPMAKKNNSYQSIAKIDITMDMTSERFWHIDPKKMSCPSPKHQDLILFDEDLKRTKIRMISNIKEYVSLLPKKRQWKTETISLSSGYEAIVRIYEGNPNLTSVPVTLTVYGGPDFNKVTDEFEELPTPTGYEHAIVKIDVRGSGGRGWKYRSAIYGRLVTVEVEDTIEAMELVLEKYPRFDKNRVGVEGWSYGGTMTAALVEKAPPAFFKCAIVGAPVTNFLLYNAPYSESYMGDAPPSSFTDLTLNVTAFEQTKLLLVHGLRDDTVLFQHSALLIEALQEADISFELMVYPNLDHNIYTDHFNHLSESFLSKCYDE